MSLENILKPNNNDLYCRNLNIEQNLDMNGTLTCDNVIANSANSQFFSLQFPLTDGNQSIMNYFHNAPISTLELDLSGEALATYDVGSNGTPPHGFRIGSNEGSIIHIYLPPRSLPVTALPYSHIDIINVPLFLLPNDNSNFQTGFIQLSVGGALEDCHYSTDTNNQRIRINRSSGSFPVSANAIRGTTLSFLKFN